MYLLKCPAAVSVNCTYAFPIHESRSSQTYDGIDFTIPDYNGHQKTGIVVFIDVLGITMKLRTDPI